MENTECMVQQSALRKSVNGIPTVSLRISSTIISDAEILNPLEPTELFTVRNLVCECCEHVCTGSHA